MAQQIHFTKMHGCGNNYIYVYLPDNPIENLPEASIKWSRQHLGIGSDGLITIEKSKVADFKMRIFNNDGSAAMMCGNGVRCCGKFVRDHHLTEKSEVTFETLAGLKTLQLYEGEDGKVNRARVDMGKPVIDESLTMVDGWQGTSVSMGNPHYVIFVDDVNEIDLEDVGPKLEHNKAFPNR
jgi:diaminopimelate epimerase